MNETQDIFIIEGLGGQRGLKGKIETEGSKNAVLKALAAAALFRDELNLTNVPNIEDVNRMLEVLEDLGVGIVKKDDHAYQLLTKDLNKTEIAPAISKKMRSSIVITGPLLARLGEVSFPHPGGCVIGKRPIDIFLDGFEKMGATIKLEKNIYTVSAPGKKLKGTELFLRLPSVTVTETFMMAAVLAEGKTLIKNAALEPEIGALGEFLNSCGAKISGLNTPTLEIEGGELLSGTGKIYKTMPDRIAAGSFVILAALAGDDIEITNCEPKHLDALLAALRQGGVEMEIGKSSIRIKNNLAKKLTAVDIKTHEYPGFPTDLQAPMSVFQTQAEGQSFIFETIFEGRLNYLETMARFGAKVRVLDAHRATIDGPTALDGKEVESPDLRAGLAYVLAGIIAKGETIVHNVYYIDRGYENIDERLRKLGVNIKRVS